MYYDQLLGIELPDPPPDTPLYVVMDREGKSPLFCAKTRQEAQQLQLSKGVRASTYIEVW